MKASILSGIIIFFVNIFLWADNPPAAVKQAFQQKFPNATKVKWEKEEANEWEAEFILENKEMSASFAANGTWLETETEIVLSQLPENVLNTLKKQYAGWKILEPEKVETAQHGVLYEVELKKQGEKKKEVQLKEDGTFINM